MGSGEEWLVQDIIYVMVENNAEETLGEMIRHILGSGDAFQENEVLFYPLITDCKVSDIHMMGASGRFASIGH